MGVCVLHVCVCTKVKACETPPLTGPKPQQKSDCELFPSISEARATRLDYDVYRCNHDNVFQSQSQRARATRGSTHPQTHKHTEVCDSQSHDRGYRTADPSSAKRSSRTAGPSTARLFEQSTSHISRQRPPNQGRTHTVSLYHATGLLLPPERSPSVQAFPR